MNMIWHNDKCENKVTSGDVIQFVCEDTNEGEQLKHYCITIFFVMLPFPESSLIK